MSKCQDLDPLFAPYADGDVAAETARPWKRISIGARRAANALPENASSAAVLVARRTGAARRARPSTCAPGARRIASGGAALPSALRAARRWLPLSVAATLVLAVAGAFVFGFNDSVEALAAQLTLDHIRCFQFAPERLTHVDAGGVARLGRPSRAGRSTCRRAHRRRSSSSSASAAA